MPPEKWEKLKSELAALSLADQRMVIGYLVSIRMTKEERESLARKIDDKDPAHWVTIEELNNRLGLEEPSK